MAGEEKPYRVYRSGRGKGKLPRLPSRGGVPEQPAKGSEPATLAGKGRTPLRRRYRLWFAVGLGLVLLFGTAWALASYFSFRDGVERANARLPDSVRAGLTDQDGFLLTHSTTVLLLGTDHADRAAGRSDLRHSDSIMVVRTDPDHHRIYYLSIPRDLYVSIPGVGSGRINAAFQAGGAALSLRTVRELTGLPVNHIVVVDFSQFMKLIDKIGGIEIDVPERIESNRFDCPLKTSVECAQWTGWRFAKGRQHMDGRRALVYSRVRENRLNPADDDITRAERQQGVLQAIAGKLASVGTFLDLPAIGGDLLAPLATDLSTDEFLELGWVYWRSGSGRAVHCRLGGESDSVRGSSVIMPNEDNRAAIAMFKGESAPQPPPPGSGTFGPGCVVGKRTLGAR